MPGAPEQYPLSTPSLPPAEILEPDSVQRGMAGQIASPSTNPGALLLLAWSRVEHPLATPETAPDTGEFDLAREHLETIIGAGLALREDAVTLGALTLRGYLPAFQYRAEHRDDTIALSEEPGLVDETRLAVGGLLGSFIHGSKAALSKKHFGKLSELIALYGFFLAGEFPWPGSYREEANQVVEDNHDLYLFPGAIYMPGTVKLPVQVKHLGPREESQQLLTLRIGVIAFEAARRNRAYAERTQRGDLRADGAATILLGRIMAQHSLGKPLKTHERQFLETVVKAFRAEEAAFQRRRGAVRP